MGMINKRVPTQTRVYSPILSQRGKAGEKCLSVYIPDTRPLGLQSPVMDQTMWKKDWEDWRTKLQQVAVQRWCQPAGAMLSCNFFTVANLPINSVDKSKVFSGIAAENLSLLHNLPNRRMKYTCFTVCSRDLALKLGDKRFVPAG